MKILVDYYDDLVLQFCDRPSDKEFVSFSKSLKKRIIKKPSKKMFDDIVNIINDLKNEYKIEFGSIQGTKNYKELCIIKDKNHVKFVDYEWVRNYALSKIENLYSALQLKHFSTELVNVLNFQKTNKVTKIQSDKFYNGILFSNGFFDLRTFEFKKEKEDSIIFFPFDFKYEEYNENNFPNLYNLIKTLNKITSNKLLSITIFMNILDFNSDKRFLTILESKQGSGKSWFMNFLERLFGVYCSSISFNYIINEKALFETTEKILLIDHDISKRHIKDPSQIKKIITGDNTQIRKLYLDSISIRPISTFLWGLNHKINLREDLTSSDGLNRRTLYLNWKNKLYKNTYPHWYKKHAPIPLDITKEIICGIISYYLDLKKNDKNQ